MTTDVCTLDQVYDHLRIPENQQTTALSTKFQLYISALDEVITNLVGDLSPTAHEEWHDGGTPFIVVDHTPIITVELLTELYGMTVFTLQLQPLDGSVPRNFFGYSIDAATGRIDRRQIGADATPFAFGDKNVHVKYTSGLQTMPASVTLAAMEDIRALYQMTEQGGRPAWNGASDESPDTRSPMHQFPRVELLLAGMHRTPGLA